MNESCYTVAEGQAMISSIYMCKMTHSYMCDMTHSYMCDMTHSYMSDMTHSYMSDMTHSNACEIDSFMCVCPFLFLTPYRSLFTRYHCLITGEKKPICSKKQKGAHIDEWVMSHINQGANSAAEQKETYQKLNIYIHRYMYIHISIWMSHVTL